MAYYINGLPVDEEEYFKNLPEPNIEEQKLEQLRQQRRELLRAFDIWEKAVLRGREEESNEIMDWYHDLLDLKEEAFENIPERIQYYLY